MYMYMHVLYSLSVVLMCNVDLPQLPPQGQGDAGQGVEDHDEKPVKSAFDPTGYDKDLVEALERDIVQKNPNVKW